MLKPQGGPKIKFTISALEENRRYADTSRFPGATLVFDHTVEERDGETYLAARVTVTGPLSWIWARILRSGFETGVQKGLDQLVALVEAEQGGVAHKADE